MRIQDILSEDDTMKIKSVSGDEVTIDQGGSEIKTTTDALTPSADKPGAFQMKPADPSKMAPGAEVTQATSEEYEEEGQNTPYFIEMSSGTPMVKVDAGKTVKLEQGKDVLDNIESVEQKINQQGFMLTKVQAGGKQFSVALSGTRCIAGPKTFQAIMAAMQQHEGKKDIGGDATDRFIKQVKDKGFERKNRSPGSDGSASTLGSGKLKESDELMKWLTIAGIK